MSECPEEIRILDLAEPILTPMQREVRQALEKRTIELREDVVLQAAREQTGLHDFGADDFRERLAVWLAAVDEDENTHAVGRMAVYNDCVRYAGNRLRFEDLLRLHPEILEVEIRAPIIIAGLPRSGTTHLLNLISADERLRSLPYWESLEPVPVPGEEPTAGQDDPRLGRCRKASALQDALLPHLRAMHFMTPEHIHEEIELQALDFSSYLLEWIAYVPRWRDYYLAHDQTAHYAYMKNVLKALQWMHGPDRWILKSPQHLEQLIPLQQTFPDATIVFTHRDPVSVIQSTITMLSYGDRMRAKHADPQRVARYWTDRIERMLRVCVRDRDTISQARSLDVLFHEFMADDVGMVERIYDVAGLPMTPATHTALDGFMDHHPRGLYGRVRYDLREDFGIDPAALRKRFDFYFERFPIRVEDGSG